MSHNNQVTNFYISLKLQCVRTQTQVYYVIIFFRDYLFCSATNMEIK